MIKFVEFKRFFIFNLIGSLVVSALIAVVTVLIGEFNEILGRVLLTLLTATVHSLISLVFIWDDERKKTFERLAFFINILFGLIVVSFITSIFEIWKIISSETVSHLYQTYVIIGFASLHGDILSKTLRKEKYIDIIVYVNYVVMAIVAFMLQPLIYIENVTSVLNEMYFRILGAVGIIDGTLSILTIIFYKLYIHKHPKIHNQLGPKKGLSIWVWILIIYLVLQVVLPLVFLAFESLFRLF